MADKDELFEVIRDEVVAAMLQADHSMRMTELREAGATAFALAYDEAGGDTDRYERAEMEFLNTLNAAAAHTNPDGSEEQVDRVALMLATAAANAAVVAAAGPGTELRWITMLDDAVRDLHRPLHGEVRAAGQPFIVGGVPLMYPGQPVGPPEGWINCRCVLHAALTAASEGATMPWTIGAQGSHDCAGFPVLVKGTDEVVGCHDTEAEATAHVKALYSNVEEASLEAASDKPWSDFSASDYSIEQWRRACLLKMPGGDPESKATYKLPVREPGGALNRNGVHAAAAALGGARGGVDAPAEAKAAAKRKLRGMYRQLKEEPPDSLKADAESQETLVGWAPSTSPPGTHDAPGWITHPRATQRLRTYWTKGEGAAKIRWGQPGDFDRCRRQLRKYVVNPAHLAGTCANLHFVALGFWPGQGPHASAEPPNLTSEGDAVTAAFAAAAELDDELPPLEWFEDPGFDGPTPLTVTADGRVLGHLATWGTCHVGITKACTEAPRSKYQYAYFRTGEAQTAAGSVPVGQITMDTGHAGTELDPNATVSHYDNTGTVVADVAAGEDDHGIWIAGQLRPGITDQQLRALRAGSLSGDWRRIGGNLELVAALVVNVPGFPIPRTEMAASAMGATALVAAAVVTADPNSLDADRIAIAVIERLDARERRVETNARVAALRAQINGPRVAELVSAVEAVGL